MIVAANVALVRGEEGATELHKQIFHRVCNLWSSDSTNGNSTSDIIWRKLCDTLYPQKALYNFSRTPKEV